MKMYRLIFLLFLLAGISFSTTAQKPQFGLVGSVDYTYRTLDNQPMRDSYEEALFFFRVGFDYETSISESIRLKTGLRYAKSGYKTSEEDLKWGEEHDGQGRYLPDPLTPYPGTGEHIFQFLEIPLLMHISLGEKGPFFLEAGPGIIVSLDGEWMDRHKTNVINVSANLGLGVTLLQSEKIRLFTLPVFRFHLFNTFASARRENLFSGGLEMGVRFY